MLAQSISQSQGLLTEIFLMAIVCEEAQGVDGKERKGALHVSEYLDALTPGEKDSINIG